MPYSVETVSCLPSSADCSVCQASVAHLTRAGNFGDAAETLPACPVGRVRSLALGVAGNQAVKLLEELQRLFLVLPFRICVIIEADAREMAQPEPWNPMSLMASPSTSR